MTRCIAVVFARDGSGQADDDLELPRRAPPDASTQEQFSALQANPLKTESGTSPIAKAAAVEMFQAGRMGEAKIIPYSRTVTTINHALADRPSKCRLFHNNKSAARDHRLSE